MTTIPIPIPTTDSLVAALRETGFAGVPLGPNMSTQDARALLIGAARAAGIRVKVSRDPDPTSPVMVAKALSTEDALAQSRRSAFMRAARHIEDAVKVLSTELVAPSPTDYDPADDVSVLTEIANDLLAAGQA